MRKSILFEDIFPASPIALALAINAVTFALFFLTVTPGFDTNDDTAMMMITSGFVTGEPSEYLIHMSVLLGRLLKALYILAPAVNWYSVLLYSTHFAAMTALLYVFIALGRNLFSILLFFVLFIFFEAFMLTHLQFTSTAFVAATGGFILLLSCLAGGGGSTKTKVGFALALMALAAMIRFHTIFGMAVMAVPILLLRYVETRSASIPLVVGVVIALSWGLVTYDRSYYEEHGYPKIRQYQRAVQAITGEPTRVTDGCLQAVGWSANDLQLLQQFFWLDKETYSDGKVTAFSALTKSFNDAPAVGRAFSTDITFRKKGFLVAGLVCLLALCLLFAWFSTAKGKTRYEAVLLATLLLATLGLTYAAKAPLRVILSLVFVACAVSFYFAVEFQDRERAARTLKLHFLIILALSASFQFFKINKDSRWNKEKQKEYYQAMGEINARKGSLFVIVAGDFPYTGIPLFRNPKPDSTFNILITGWFCHTPLYDRVLHGFSATDIMKAFPERKNIYIIGGNEKFAEAVVTFYEEHYRRKVFLDLDVGTKEGFGFLKPRKVIYPYPGPAGQETRVP